ncbi:MAG: hypothetical protein ABSH11_06765 [Verrucomicrobiota bacterium]
MNHHYGKTKIMPKWNGKNRDCYSATVEKVQPNSKAVSKARYWPQANAPITK